MKKLVFLGTVAALALCLAVQGQWQVIQSPVTTAMKELAEADYKEDAFASLYNWLDGIDTGQSLTFAILFPWLSHAVDGAWARTHSPAAKTAGAAITTPTRSPAPVERLTITAFKIGTTSFLFKAEWPVTQEFPKDSIDVLFNMGLEPEYWAPILRDVPVTPSLLEQEFEVLFDEFDVHDGGVPPPVGFFRIRPSYVWEEEEQGYIRDNWDWEELGDPPDDPPLVDWDGGNATVIYLANLENQSSSKTMSFPVKPGQQYVIWLEASCNYGYYPLYDDIFSWEITIPGGQVISDSFGTSSLVYGDPSAPFFRDFWIVTIPWVEPSRAGDPVIDLNLYIASKLPPVHAAGYTTVGGFSRIQGAIKNASLYQHNMPMSVMDASGKVTGSTDFGNYANQYIRTNGVAYITGQPAPPDLRMSMPSPNGMSFAWRMTVETERPEYRTCSALGRDPDYRKYPTNGQYTAYTTYPHCLITGTLMGNEIIGGKCKIYYKIRDDETGQVKEDEYPFKIHGLNPPDALARVYIDDVMPAFCKSYGWALIRHESKQKNRVYNQFNTGGDTIHWPNKTDDIHYVDKKTGTNAISRQWGWGISQIDRKAIDDPSNTVYVTTAEMYNWRTNVDSAVGKIVASQATYERFKGYFKATWGDSVEPPQNVPYKVGGLTMTTEQFAVCILYNGADKETIPRSYVWKGKYELDGKTPKPEVIYSPVAFNPTGNGNWTFHDNVNSYAARIAAELQDTNPKQE